MTPTELSRFLLARIAEDQERADVEDILRRGDPYYANEASGYERHFSPGRIDAECDAKRRIVAAELLREVGPASHYISAEIHAAITERTTTPVLRLLALPYADHPDYREEWRP